MNRARRRAWSPLVGTVRAKKSNPFVVCCVAKSELDAPGDTMGTRNGCEACAASTHRNDRYSGTMATTLSDCASSNVAAMVPVADPSLSPSATSNVVLGRISLRALICAAASAITYRQGSRNDAYSPRAIGPSHPTDTEGIDGTMTEKDSAADTTEGTKQ